MSLNHHHYFIECIFHTTAEATKKATDLFQQKQFEQHHHHVHVPRSPFEESTYLDSLAKFGTGDEDYDGSGLHKEPPKGYLDTLSEVGKKRSTWGVYKDQVEKAKKEVTNHDEVDCKNTCLFVYTLHSCWLAGLFVLFFVHFADDTLTIISPSPSHVSCDVPTANCPQT